MKETITRLLSSQWSLAFRVLPFVAAFVLGKLALHQVGWEWVSVGPVLTSMIAATVFLLGFLISGTLSDYKESERLPGEMMAIMQTIADECQIIYRSKQAAPASDCLKYLAEFAESLLRWFRKEERTRVILEEVAGLSEFFREFESLTQANFIARLKQEQNLLRRTVIRIDTIRDTQFVSAGYVIAEIASGLLISAFLLAKFEPFYESLFIFGVVTFMLLYMLFLIRELDNPFSHYESRGGGATVSLKLLEDTRQDLEERVLNIAKDARQAHTH